MFVRYFRLTFVSFSSLAVNTFSTEADKAQMDLTADNEQSRHLQTQLKKWDRKKKKMITIDKVCTLCVFIHNICLSQKIKLFITNSNSILRRRIRKQERYVPNQVYGYLLHTKQIVTTCGKRRVKSKELTKTIARRSLYR